MAILNDLKSNFLFFDGAMGTQLQAAGLIAGELPEKYNFTHPDIVSNIHRKYLSAGSNIIQTNTFGANAKKLAGSGLSVEEVIIQATKLAKEATKEFPGRYVALDIGPIGQMLAPLGTLTFDEAYEIFAQQVRAGVKAGCDCILIETIADLYEAKIAVLAAKENSDLPVFCTMTFDISGRTFMGTPPLAMVLTLEGLGVDAIGLNCSLGPKESFPIIEEILTYASIPVMIQANAGLPVIVDGETQFLVEPDEFSDLMIQMAHKGVRILGGCCGTDERFIQEMVTKLANTSPLPLEEKIFTGVCSATKTTIIDDIRIIGERLNPTGKKALKEALKTQNLDYIFQLAIEQEEAGADILDVNVGLAEIDELEMMKTVIKELQAVTSLPLQIDSGKPNVLEAATRLYNGKPILNSVNGTQENMHAVFPIVKKYGTGIIGLTIDEDGIPTTAQKRLKIARSIVNTALEYGINKKDIFIDCLVLTASSQQDQIKETLEAIKMVTQELGVKTTLGVSNVSFGLPNRPLLNHSMLTLALAAGLDAPIMNPSEQSMVDAINSFRVLMGIDMQSSQYVKYYADTKSAQTIISKTTSDLGSAIMQGLKQEAKDITHKLLAKTQPLDIIDKQLMPALTEVGTLYEKGILFLPQLLQSAEAAKYAFQEIKDFLINSQDEFVSKGQVILATVQGDVHDIGKNIVKVIMENYGFTIYDLGKDVPIQKVVDEVIERNISLVGLSALMTTTVENMEKTIKAIRQISPKCKIVVGGAVLTPELAEKIGADFYAKDALETVAIAQKVFS